MKLVSCAPRGFVLFALLALFCSGDADAKPIRLRNRVIETDASTPSGKFHLASTRSDKDDARETSGLFLIQLAGTPRTAWRDALRAQGVELLDYVPNDAFVARLDKVKPGQIRRLGFVRWLGQYKTEDKLHPRLRRAVGLNSTSKPIDVAVLLSPSANEADTARTERLFQTVRMESRSRFGRIIRGTLSEAQVETLAQSDAVLWIEPSERMQLFDEVSSKIVAGDGGLNLLRSQVLGYDGAGVTVAVADTGLDTADTNTMHPDLLGRVTGFFQYGTLVDWSDPHGHGTHCAGIIAGNGAAGTEDGDGALYGLGIAPGANIVAQRLFDASGKEVESPPSFEKLTQDAKESGADIGSNSWGDDAQGRYDLNAMEFDALVRDADTNMPGDQPYTLIFAAGNAGPGPQTIASPAVAKNVIAVGACQSARTNFGYYSDGINAMADFSSRGPCEDGRFKPDLVAPGTWIASLKSQLCSDAYAWAAISSNYMYEGGTSQAGPHVAGAAAVFIQFFRQHHGGGTPSPAMVKAALINAAQDMSDPTQTTAVPNNDEGWGRADLTRLLDSGCDFDFVDQSSPLTNGQTFERHLLVESSDDPLKVILTYTDVPGFPGAIPALVNDLDLEVVGPDGESFHGNQFSQGESVPGARGWDSVNNVEGVLIPKPSPGQYIVKVHARNVVMDSRTDTAATDQDFALVTSGRLAGPGESIVVLARHAYTAPGVMKITVIDSDVAGSPSVAVTAHSDTEVTGETFVLPASDVSGTFTGSVSTATGPAIADGQLQVAHGDSISVDYFDATAGSNQTATAAADLVPPILSSVSVTNRFGHTVVTWTTDEPANSTVLYNTNQSLAFAVTENALVTEHSLALDKLLRGTNYYFEVISADEAGNAKIDDNGGTLFSFIADPPATVLLVDDYYADDFGVIPSLTNYTAPLEELGVSYQIWSTFGGNTPLLGDLLAHRVVIWRLPEFNGSDTWSDAEQNELVNYLASGGSLFCASMQVLTNLDLHNSSAFWKNTLKVQSYVPDVGVPTIAGAANDPLGSGISIPLDYSPYESQSKTNNGIPIDASDVVTPASGAAPVFYNDSGGICGLRFPGFGQDSPGRVVFLSFPLDAVPMTGGNTNNRVQLLGNALRFLVPGFDGHATIALDSPAYTTPALVTVEVDDPDLAGESLDVVITNTTQGNAVSLSLSETPRKGKFRGFVTLLNVTNPPSPGTLGVVNADTVRAVYFDSSAGETVYASASVDTVVPTISNVVAIPSYVRADITWTTSKPCDALVQYGESPLSFRTAYDPTLSLTHQIVLKNLDPDTLYYFRVVSRDIAGNAVTDDNTNQLYTFTTLQPASLPWSDNLDGAAAGWSVVNGPTTQSHWALGVPNNGIETNALSPPNAWGSVLNGDAILEADTRLRSPTLYLVGGTDAKLTFWQNYSFDQPMDGYELGHVYVLTNDGGLAAEPYVFGGDTMGDWQKVEVDLTPYIGQVVQIEWYYEFLTSGPAEPRPGWLVDDVSATIVDNTPVTISLTNNLWQAKFTLNGHISASGKGRWFTTNAPPGEYSINYADVADYQTPLNRTNDLQPGQSWLVAGNYTFDDSNGNGISDEWERLNFGDTSTNRTDLTDTDGDGQPDLEEFLAGTDPNGPLPPFHVTLQVLTNAIYELQWVSAPGHSYLVDYSSDFTNWYPLSDFIVASGPSTNYDFLPFTDMPQFYRVNGTDTAEFGGPSPTLTLTTNPMPDGSVELEWPSTPDRGYRVLCSTNSVFWQPCSDWIQAVGTTTTYTNPPPTNSMSLLFRVEVQP